MVLNELRLDWYEATIECDTVGLLALIMIAGSQSDGEAPRIKIGRGKYGYKRSHQIESAYFELTIFDLGTDGWPNIIGTGQNADVARRFAKAMQCEGRVSRIDVACDSTEGWWPAYARFAEYAETHPKTLVTHYGDFYRNERGRTLYVGAPSSEKRVRIYEKGIQTEQDSNWIRVELQYRPKDRAAKAWAFKASTSEIADSSQSFIALRATEGFYSPPAYQRPGRETLLALARQYGNVLREELPDAWRIIVDHLKYEWSPGAND